MFFVLLLGDSKEANTPWSLLSIFGHSLFGEARVQRQRQFDNVPKNVHPFREGQRLEPSGFRLDGFIFQVM
jgi:hypothetical protein